MLNNINKTSIFPQNVTKAITVRIQRDLLEKIETRIINKRIFYKLDQ